MRTGPSQSDPSPSKTLRPPFNPWLKQSTKAMTPPEAELSCHDKNILAFLMPSKDDESHETKEDGKKDESTPNDQERIALETEAIKLAESNDLDGALTLITEAIRRFPDHPSPRNNRAQILRLLRRDAEAISDLDMILSSIEYKSRYPVTLRQAFAQRGWLRMAAHQTAEAREDFQESLLLGNRDAAKMVARCNPYAAMCNAMMLQVMEKYYS